MTQAKNTPKEIVIREAEEADLPYLLEMAELFCKLSCYKMEFDRDQSWKTLYNYFLDKDSSITLCLIDGNIVGGVIFSMVKDWCVKPICYISKFFVDPAAWGTRAARSLMQRMCDISEEKGCSHIFATATANISGKADIMFENLFKKFGFYSCGATLARDLI